MIKYRCLPYLVCCMASLLVISCSSDDDLCDVENAIALDFGSCLIFEDNGVLDSTRNTIIDVVESTIKSVNDLMPVENLRFIIRSNSANVIPEIGIGGFNPNEDEIIISINPDFANLEMSLGNELFPLIAHEMHHARRRRAVGYGTSLLQASISEGLADCFAMEVAGINPPIWSVAITGTELEEWIETASDDWNTSSYDHSKWFFGTDPEVPRWIGYSMGFKIVKDFLEANPDRRASDLFDEPATSFVP